MRDLVVVILLALAGCGPMGLPVDDPDGGADALADGAACGGPWQLCCGGTDCAPGLTCRRLPNNVGAQTRICVP